MKFETQVREIEELIEYTGFIFYPNSKRYVQTTANLSVSKKVGVFVNAEYSEITTIIDSENLDVVQLHGSESPEECAQLRRRVEVIKAFGVDTEFDFNSTFVYESHVDFFLFDTKTVHHGGSGVQFDWLILDKYRGSTPFFLSGGINSDSATHLKAIRHPQFYGIDLNSGFENNPGDKNCELLKTFIHQIRN